MNLFNNLPRLGIWGVCLYILYGHSLYGQICIQQTNIFPDFLDQRITNSIFYLDTMEAADIDLDGFTDLILFGYDRGFQEWISIFLNDGNGNFMERQIRLDDIFSHFSPRFIEIKDIDLDGDIDILLNNYDPHLIWLENDGELNFQHHIIDTTQVELIDWGLRVIIARDGDNDGDIDIIAGYTDPDYSFDIIRIYENIGDNLFEKSMFQSKVSHITAIDMEDMDKDGDLDLLLAGNWSHHISWMENDGQMNFTEYIFESQYPSPFNIKAEDFDQDGNMDILATFPNDQIIIWYKNDGMQHFESRTISQVPIKGDEIQTADINLDGYMDIVIPSQTDSGVVWIENIENQQFHPHKISETNTVNPHKTSLADFDGDGDIDIVFMDNYDDLLIYHQNLSERDTDKDGLPDCLDNCPSKPNAGLCFDGESDFAVVSQIDGIVSPHTLEAWIYVWEFPKSSAYLASLGNDEVTAHSWIIDSTGILSVGHKYANRPKAQLTVGKWTHIAATYQPGNHLTLFVDGERQASLTTGLITSNGKLSLGGLRMSELSFFSGCMDEIRIWNDLRSLNEIRANMSIEISANEDNLVAYYRLNEGTPGGENNDLRQMIDHAANEQHGNIIGFQGSGRLSNWGMGAPLIHEDANGNGIGDFCEGIVNPIEESLSTSEAAIQILPNPAKHKLSIKHPESTSSIRVQIYDIAGRVLIDEKHPAKSSNQALSVNIQGLSSGAYFVHVQGSNWVKNGKLVVE